ncbi:iron chelate uptake ABC transporter family permease subunit [Microbacterium esteraromaticum]|uniref:Iron chelate uptake ABC transporter family permease subunit n=1 Tax=Microbacterium esteraromaticum TaxID=57043 RepID=A0A939DTE4_9MICO|nr:iron chelate uptake ABC transporter family permease subunit [Microbacterium esteraromaticum]MBN8204657.1 iron chelate uptake ABC transporter family permease subunit [Microbacterium esteraromaticum]MBN8414811.1 iron chelate uptake ABC transporter family permease subunit [Microbacterium esteraromaticum]WDH78829.1 iron chelate uptake ABC transporter family permease subunit [Microbacterium esteraromaticum]
MTQLDFGRTVYRVGKPERPVLMLDARSVVVCSVLWVATFALACFAMATGSAQITLGEVLQVIAGAGDDYTNMVVAEWRAPRILLAILLGACLAISGAIFQNLTGNPLGSPDVIGFQTGSFTGALIVMLVLRGGSVETMIAALIGGMATALVVFSLSITRGAVRGVRLIIVGIGVSAMLASFNVWLMLTATVEDALMAGLWGAGSLAGVTWWHVALAGAAAAVFLVAAGLLSRPMRLMRIGAPFATALGQRVRSVQVAAVIVGVALTAIATATIGPVSFIALAAPQIARRLVPSDGLALAPTAAVGAFLLLLADVVAQRIHPHSPLPVGIVTVCIGGLYFLWLLMREGKTR